MSRLSREIVILGSLTEPDAPLVVESSELREAIGLRWILRPCDDWTSPAKLGRRIDDCLVENISYQLWYVESGLISIEDFKWVVHRIEEGMKEDTALRVFAATLQEFKRLPLASETYLELAKRKALHDGRPAPFFEEGLRLARVLLADFIKNEKLWETDWDGEIYTRLAVAMYMDNRDPRKLQERIDDSERSPTEWEVLEHICVALAARGEDPPEELLRWWFRATHGLLKRPDGGSAPSNRPRKLGYMFRDNEIRHTVDLLAKVGMPKEDCHKVVGKDLFLSLSRIQQICLKPSWMIQDLKEHALKRLDASSPHLQENPSAA